MVSGISCKIQNIIFFSCFKCSSTLHLFLSQLRGHQPYIVTHMWYINDTHTFNVVKGQDSQSLLKMRVTERIKILMYNKLIKIDYVEAGPGFQQGQFHGLWPVQLHRALCSEGPWTWSPRLHSHHLEILNNFIFEFVFYKRCPPGQWSMNTSSWAAGWQLCMHRFRPAGTGVSREAKQLWQPREIGGACPCQQGWVGPMVRGQLLLSPKSPSLQYLHKYYISCLSSKTVPAEFRQ